MSIPNSSFYLISFLFLVLYPIKKLKWLFSFLCLSLGILILAPVFGHLAPWDLQYFQILWEQKQVQLIFHNTNAIFDPLSLGIAFFLLLLGLLILNPIGPQMIKYLFSKPGRIFLFLFCISTFIFTLIPTKTGAEIILDLGLGMMGTFFIILGIWPVFYLLFIKKEPSRFLHFIFQFWHSLCLKPWFFPTFLFVFVFTLTNLGSYFLFYHVPHIVDSMDQYLHAKMFLLGKLFVPSPVPREFFDMTHMINNGQWYSQYPPGHTLLLAVGFFFHAPWIINPLFGSLSVVLLYWIGKEMGGESTAKISGLLGAFSPFLLIMSYSFMNHVTTLFFLELFILGFIKMIKQMQIQPALLSGFGLGYALTIRPYTVLSFAVPFVLYYFFKLFYLLYSERKKAYHFLFAGFMAFFVFLIFLFLLFYFNYCTNGDPFKFGYEVTQGINGMPGFGHSGCWGIPHSPSRGLAGTLNNLNALNLFLFGLPFPCLFLPLLGLVWIPLRSWNFLLLGSIFSLTLAYFFYWYQDWALGPRYLFCSIAPLCLLTAQAIVTLPEFLKKMIPAYDPKQLRRGITILFILSLILGWSQHAPSMVKTFSGDYHDMRIKVFKFLEQKEPDFKKAVILVPRFYYPSVFFKNDPFLNGAVIYAMDMGPFYNQNLIRKFPDRQFYILCQISFDKFVLNPYPSMTTK